MWGPVKNAPGWQQFGISNGIVSAAVDILISTGTRKPQNGTASLSEGYSLQRIVQVSPKPITYGLLSDSSYYPISSNFFLFMKKCKLSSRHIALRRDVLCNRYSLSDQVAFAFLLFFMQTNKWNGSN